MKIARFLPPASEVPVFGGVIGTHVVGFGTLLKRSGLDTDIVSNSRIYLSNLPDSEDMARKLLDWGAEHLSELGDDEVFSLESVQLLAPVEVAALFDFGLTPTHLRNSLETFLKLEHGNPKTEPILNSLKAGLISEPEDKPSAGPQPLSYYKCNMNSIVGDGQHVPWPTYTARLDIEPELAVIYGNTRQPVSGYCIFNDISARDVQVPEFIGGLCLSKDMGFGNQLGPFLVTADEVGNPFDQDVDVIVNGKARFKGSTSEISHGAEDIFQWMEMIGPIRPGTVFGFGTTPGCTGLDFDDFLDPGDTVEIRFSRLGALKCTLEEPKSKLSRSRWPVRKPLERFYE
ncbi:fumarylacetoacetate hydrolase family protein [Chachezhania sediminis]|uniref:fumarylacetoacetate hydrolase family protein n=1 Tax=Chachezhania sediminis TaxID=2599291 RepID=UPI00131B2A78|nr:fumarylacetoacetate hydrolase family protein [Chachezhania sediminis]